MRVAVVAVLLVGLLAGGGKAEGQAPDGNGGEAPGGNTSVADAKVGTSTTGNATKDYRDAPHDYLGVPSSPKMVWRRDDLGDDTINDPPVAEEDKSFWQKSMQEDLAQKLKNKEILKKAKNVIFFLADGTGIATLTAARMLKGQRTGNFEREIMSYETFPYSGILKTYNTNQQTTDSAASATAYLTGVKGNQKTIGVDANVLEANCSTMPLHEDHLPKSIARNFQEAGRASGVVTTTRVTHASPAGAYAHTAFRKWECDADLEEAYGGDPAGCEDIAGQLAYGPTGLNLNVVMGGGRSKMLPRTKLDPEPPHSPGERLDPEDLTETWVNLRHNAQYVWSRDQLRALDLNATDNLLGLFDYSHLAYKLDEDESNPTLEEMTRTAIEVLQKNQHGFFLFVEGGMIDMAHHYNMPRYALEEAVEFEAAVAAAAAMTSEEDTLIIVTADHSQPVTINGYTPRGADILGLGDTSDTDHLPFTTLLYTNGPGYRGSTGGRHSPTALEVAAKDYATDTTVPTEDAFHNGEDVMVFARGPHSHLFSGVHENSYLPHALRYAACVGGPEDLSFCAGDDDDDYAYVEEED